METTDQLSQPGVGAGTDQPAAPASETGPSPGQPETPWHEGLDADQVDTWHKSHDNRDQWYRENTQRSQALSEQRAALDAQTRRFYSNPVNRRVHELSQQVYNPDGTVNEQRFAQLERLAAGMQQGGGQDPLVAGLAGQIRELQGRVQQVQWAGQQAQEAQVQAETLAAVEQYREQHADMYPDTPEGDAAIQAFVRSALDEVGTTNLEYAHRALYFDQELGRARESARETMTDKEVQAQATATGLQPGAHEAPPPVEADGTDVNFKRAAAECLRDYGDVDYEGEG